MYFFLAKQQNKSNITDELISPLTGTKIPASKVQEHMRIGLLDPRWVEQRDKHIQDKMNQESVYAPGDFSVLITYFILFILLFFLSSRMYLEIVLLAN